MTDDDYGFADSDGFTFGPGARWRPMSRKWRYPIPRSEGPVQEAGVSKSKRKNQNHRTANVDELPWTEFVSDPEAAAVLGDSAVFVNSKYQVSLRNVGDVSPFGHVAWLSIKRRDKRPIRNWRDLQRIKNDICGKTCEAIEIYPSEDRLVDSANQYHLYVFTPGYVLPLGFTTRFVYERSVNGTVQEPFKSEHRPADLDRGDNVSMATRADQPIITKSTRLGLERAAVISRKGGAS